MTDIYIKPVVDVFGSSLYLVRNNRPQGYFDVMLSRVELQDVIDKAEIAMKQADDYLLEHPAIEKG